MTTRRLLLVLTTIFFILYVYLAAVRPLVLSFLILPGLPSSMTITGLTLIFFLFSFTHAGYLLGWRHALVFFGLSAAIPFLLEEIGVLTGRIYGGYYYTEVLGAKLWHVPLLIPISWFMMMYPCYVLVNCMIGDSPIGSGAGIGRVLWLAFVTAIVMTSRDLLIDPRLTAPPIHAWVWKQGGAYFGVPAQNYVGWFLTSFAVMAIYRLIESRVPPLPPDSVTRPIATMPLVIHSIILISGNPGGALAALDVIGPFVIGLPLLMALARLWFQVPGRELVVS